MYPLINAVGASIYSWLAPAMATVERIRSDDKIQQTNKQTNEILEALMWLFTNCTHLNEFVDVVYHIVCVVSRSIARRIADV